MIPNTAIEGMDEMMLEAHPIPHPPVSRAPAVDVPTADAFSEAIRLLKKHGLSHLIGVRELVKVAGLIEDVKASVKK